METLNEEFGTDFDVETPSQHIFAAEAARVEAVGMEGAVASPAGAEEDQLWPSDEEEDEDFDATSATAAAAASSSDEEGSGEDGGENIDDDSGSDDEVAADELAALHGELSPRFLQLSMQEGRRSRTTADASPAAWLEVQQNDDEDASVRAHSVPSTRDEERASRAASTRNVERAESSRFAPWQPKARRRHLSERFD
jgi:hypothetical protein